MDLGNNPIFNRIFGESMKKATVSVRPRSIYPLIGSPGLNSNKYVRCFFPAEAKRSAI